MKGRDVMRRQTKQYIDDNPTSIILTRNTKSPDGAGGSTTTPVALDTAQVFRIVQASENTTVERRNADGKVVRPSLNLICEWDADIRLGDTFTWQDNLACEVVWITYLGYEKTAEVSVR